MTDPWRFGSFERILLTGILFVLISLVFFSLAAIGKVEGVEAEFYRTLDYGVWLLISASVVALLGRPLWHATKRAGSIGWSKLTSSD